MPNWKKVITSGSDASLNQITASTGIKGTLDTAAQTNITSVGTLGSLTVTGNITANGNIVGDDGTNITNINTIKLDKIEADAAAGTFMTFNAADIKTEGSDVIFNDGGDDVEFQVKGSGDDNLLMVNPNSNGRIGIGTANPTKKLQVEGDISASGFISTTSHITASGDISSSGGVLFSSASIKTGLDKLVAYDTSTGQFHITASSGFHAAGGGGASALNDLSDVTYSSGDLTISSLDKLVVGSFELASSGDVNLTVEGNDFIIDNGTTSNQFHLHLEDSIELDIACSNIAQTFTIDCNADIALEAAGADISLGTGTGTQEFIFNCDDAPELDVDGDFTIDGSGDITLDSATNVVDIVGNLTASANISASGAITSSGFNLVGSGTAELEVAGHITASGNISASGDITSNTLNVNTSGELTGSYGTLHGAFNINYGNATTFSASLASAGDGYGEIISHLPINGPSAGDIVYHTGADWRLADADGTGKSVQMLGVALADGGNVPGPVLIRGMVRLGAGHIVDSSGQNGDPLYLSTTDSHVQFAVPGSGDVARIVGYCIDENNDIIYFNPSSTFVEVS